MKELIEAMNNAMKELPLIGKNMEVGFGQNKYKGVSWSDVASAFNPVFKKNGLVIVPTDYDVKTKPESFQDHNGKLKHRVFVEVKATYKVLHVSGQSIELSGVGQGVDTQDKAVGKATTYAYKNMLMYMFTVAGDMDDIDNTHSDDLPQQTIPVITPAQANELLSIAKTKNAQVVEQVKSFYKITNFSQTPANAFDVVKQALEGIQ